MRERGKEREREKEKMEGRKERNEQKKASTVASLHLNSASLRDIQQTSVVQWSLCRWVLFCIVLATCIRHLCLSTVVLRFLPITLLEFEKKNHRNSFTELSVIEAKVQPLEK